MVGAIGSSTVGGALSPLLARAGGVVDPIAPIKHTPQSQKDTGNSRSFASITQEAFLSDAQITSQINRAVTQAGTDSSVNVDYRYGVAPNGKLYIASATVSATERVNIYDTDVPLSPKNVSLPASPIASGEQAGGLSAGEREAVRQLQSADVAVRSHEAQHLHAAGGLASGTPDYVYQQGPDGRYYAVAGAVNIQTGATSDPEAAARQAQTLALAASAPADASAQDNAVASSALSSVGQPSKENFIHATQRYNNTINESRSILFPNTSRSGAIDIRA